MLDDQLTHARPQPLVRSLGVLGVLFLTLSVTTPASSVFVIVPGMLQSAGTGTVWALLIAGLICIATAYVYAELSSAWPIAGGEYVMVAHTLGPGAGFVMLGINLVNNLLFPPVASLGVSAMLANVVPGLPTIPTAIAVLAGATAVSVLNIRVNAWLTGIFLLVELGSLLAVAWFGFGGIGRPLATMLSNPVMPVPTGLVPASAASLGVATTIGIFALNGYGAAVYFGEEMHEAPRRIARTIIIAVVLALALIAIPVFAALMGAPDLRALLVADDPFGMLVGLRGGSQLAVWVAVGVVIAIVNAVIACILATARFLYGTARDRSWGRPLDPWMAAIHPRHGSPWLGTLLIGVFTIGCCFVPLTFLLVVSGAGLVAIYAGIAVAVIVSRQSGTSGTTGYRMPLFPLAPLVTLAALAYVLWSSWLDVEEGRPALIATAAQILLAVAYYRFVLKRRGDWTVHIPDCPSLAQQGASYR
jgi:amino acid transporter